MGQKAAIQQLQDTNQRLEQEIRDRQLHQELEALDRHWAIDRQRLRPQDNAVVPILLGLFGFGLVGVSLLASLVAPVFCIAAFIGLPFLLISLIWYLSLRKRADTYRRAENHYFHYRQQMINRWSAASQPS